jgi:hypothetical protein
MSNYLTRDHAILPKRPQRSNGEATLFAQRFETFYTLLHATETASCSRVVTKILATYVAMMQEYRHEAFIANAQRRPAAR